MRQRQRDQPLRSRGGRRRSIRQLVRGGRRQQPRARVYESIRGLRRHLPLRGWCGQSGLWPGRQLYVGRMRQRYDQQQLHSVDLCSSTGRALGGSGHPYVPDTANNRVLEFNTPLTSGVTAAKVFGQDGDFTLSSCDFDTDNSVATAVDMCDPSGVVVNSSNLYVADSDNSRVLEFNDPLGASTTANAVFGQGGSFTSNDCDFDTFADGSTDVDLCDPIGVALDGSGNLYVADDGNSRVLEFNTPLSNETADTVFGTCGNFTASSCTGISPNNLSAPSGLAVDASDNLYVSDYADNRVLRYDTPLTTDTTADAVLGQLHFTHG